LPPEMHSTVSSSCILLLKFFLLHDNAPTHNAAFANFWPKKVTTLYHPPIISRFISARLFSVPHVENEVKGLHFVNVAEIQEAVNWWIKEGPKRGIFGSLSETIQLRKSLYMYQWSLFLINKIKLKKKVSSSCVNF